MAVDVDEIRGLGFRCEEEEEEIYLDSRVPPDAVEIWRVASRQDRELKWKRKTLDVLSVLLWAFHNGEIPNYETIGYEACCARSTVFEAIKALRSAGILTPSAPLRLAAGTSGAGGAAPSP